MRDMALKHVLITGDTHGRNCERLRNIRDNMPEYAPEETAVIILGDAGFCYYLDSSDRRHKKEASRYGYTIYCVHGNHEARPSEELGMHLIHDDFVGGTVWVEDEFPLIRYFCAWGEYNIIGRKTLVIGGAYSVDKFYRLQNGWRWFEDEQLAPHEMTACMKNAKDREFDLILSHTLPYNYLPTDMFLKSINQSTVDNTMEIWLQELSQAIEWKIWLGGHFHVDRIQAPYVEIFYQEIEPLQAIVDRWNKYNQSKELDWWLPLSPQMEKILGQV